MAEKEYETKKLGRAIVTFTAMKGKYTNRLVIDVRVKKKFKNAKELTKFLRSTKRVIYRKEKGKYPCESKY